MTIHQTLSLLVSFEYILLITAGGPFYDTTVFSLYAYRRAALQRCGSMCHRRDRSMTSHYRFVLGFAALGLAAGDEVAQTADDVAGPQ